MTHRIPVYATLVLAAFLIGRWYVDTRGTTETLQALAAVHAESTAAAAADLPADLDLCTVARVIDGDTLVLDGGDRHFGHEDVEVVRRLLALPQSKDEVRAANSKAVAVGKRLFRRLQHAM